MRDLAIVVTVILIVLKSVGELNWPWWAVFAPMLAWLGVALVLCTIVGLCDIWSYYQETRHICSKRGKKRK